MAWLLIKLWDRDMLMHSGAGISDAWQPSYRFMRSLCIVMLDQRWEDSVASHREISDEGPVS